MDSKKRHLKKEEIESLVDFIKINREIPVAVATMIYERERRKLIKQLKRVTIYPEVIPLLKDSLQAQYEKARIEPGTSVGIICAQSIGQDQTQTNLNTFHKAGSADKQP